MTKPNKPAAPNSNSYLLLAVKVLLVVVIILLLPKLVQGRDKPGKKRRRQAERQWKSMQAVCERETCGAFIPEESTMCVTQCMSPACHERIYASDLLEDGEVDLVRARDFEKCVKEELRMESRKARENK